MDAMPSLREQQAAFGAALLGRGGPPRMAIYRNNVLGNWRGALAGAYPVTRLIVGDAFFGALARAYARAHPSASGDLNEFGAGLAAFLETFPDTQDLPYLPDVARLEWRVHLAYYAAEAPPFDFSRPTGARLAPACALLESDWPLAAIWQAHQPGGDPATVDLGAGPERVLVCRPAWQVEVRALARGDYAFLFNLSAGLGPALEAGAAAGPDFHPSTALARWVRQGVLTT